MDIQILSFGLALLVGLVCFGLVRYTADEFDRWYEPPRHVAIRVPAAISALIIGLTLLVLR